MIRNALDENKLKESINRKWFCAKIELSFTYIYICSNLCYSEKAQSIITC